MLAPFKEYLVDEELNVYFVPIDLYYELSGMLSKDVYNVVRKIVREAEDFLTYEAPGILGYLSRLIKYREEIYNIPTIKRLTDETIELINELKLLVEEANKYKNPTTIEDLSKLFELIKRITYVLYNIFYRVNKLHEELSKYGVEFPYKIDEEYFEWTDLPNIPEEYFEDFYRKLCEELDYALEKLKDLAEKYCKEEYIEKVKKVVSMAKRIPELQPILEDWKKYGDKIIFTCSGWGITYGEFTDTIPRIIVYKVASADVEELLETFAHELKHFEQHITRKPSREEEAIAFGMQIVNIAKSLGLFIIPIFAIGIAIGMLRKRGYSGYTVPSLRRRK